MKKILWLLLLLALVVTGCSKKTSEETGENASGSQAIYQVEGYLLPSVDPKGPGIKLDKSLTLSRQENGQTMTYDFEEVYGLDEDIYKYVEREHFIVMEDKLVLSEAAKIKVKLEINIEDYLKPADLPVHFLSVTSYRILELNQSSDLIDYSSEDILDEENEKLSELIQLEEDLWDYLDQEVAYMDVTSNKDKISLVLKDVNHDGLLDGIAYSEDPVNHLRQVYVLINQEGDFKRQMIMESISPIIQQSFDFDGDFFHHVFTFEGTNYVGTMHKIYVMKEDRIESTQAYFPLKRAISQEPTMDFPKGYNTYLTGKLVFKSPNDYRDFTYVSTQRGSQYIHEETRYVYDEDLGDFVLTNLVASFIDPSKDILEGKDIKVGDAMGGLSVDHVDWEEDKIFDLGLVGEAVHRGRLVMFMGQEPRVVFVSMEELDQTIVYSFYKWSKEIGTLTGSLSDIGLVNEAAYDRLYAGDSLYVEVVMTAYNHHSKAESEYSTWIDLKSIHYLDEDLNTDQDDTYIGPKDLVKGEFFEGMLLVDSEYVPGQSFTFALEGQRKLSGLLTAYYDDMIGDTVLYFQADQDFLSPIQYTFDSGFQVTLDKFAGQVDLSEALEEKVMTYLLEGNDLKVVVCLESFSHAARDESEGGEYMEASLLMIQDYETIFD